LPLARQSQSERFAFDAYRRLLCMFADVVLGVERALFDAPLDEARREVARTRGLEAYEDTEALARLIPDSVLSAEHLKQVAEKYKCIIREHSTREFPADPYAQLEATIVSVFESWNNPRAKLYRAMNQIPEEWGTAVNVQAILLAAPIGSYGRADLAPLGEVPLEFGAHLFETGRDHPIDARFRRLRRGDADCGVFHESLLSLRG
jgi:phosphoenolpyruvate synthase/pyruvate phosphate dikinase